MIRPHIKYKSGGQLWGANAGGAVGIGRTASQCYADWARQMRLIVHASNNPWMEALMPQSAIVSPLMDEASVQNALRAFARMKNGM